MFVTVGFLSLQKLVTEMKAVIKADRERIKATDYPKIREDYDRLVNLINDLNFLKSEEVKAEIERNGPKTTLIKYSDEIANKYELSIKEAIFTNRLNKPETYINSKVAARKGNEREGFFPRSSIAPTIRTTSFKLLVEGSSNGVMTVTRFPHDLTAEKVFSTLSSMLQNEQVEELDISHCGAVETKLMPSLKEFEQVLKGSRFLSAVSIEQDTFNTIVGILNGYSD